MTDANKPTAELIELFREWLGLMQRQNTLKEKGCGFGLADWTCCDDHRALKASSAALEAAVIVLDPVIPDRYCVLSPMWWNEHGIPYRYGDDKPFEEYGLPTETVTNG